MGHAVTGLSQPNYKLEYNNTLIPDELLMNKKLLLTLGVASAIAASYAAKKRSGSHAYSRPRRASLGI